jgi:predicted enzyme related to lactoylglutathione lyase
MNGRWEASPTRYSLCGVLSVAALGARTRFPNPDNEHVSGGDREHPVFRAGRISYLRISATDPQASATFYEAVFGWSTRRDREDPAFDDGTGYVVGHFSAEHAVAGEGGVGPYIFVQNLDEAVAKIVESGGELLTEPYPERDLWVAVFRDPSGNVLGVWQQGPRD